MEVLRRIGQHNVMVETNEPAGISLAEDLVGPYASAGHVTLEKQQILGLLAKGDEYLPLALHWELLDRCNFACPFCYIVGHSNEKLIRFEDIRPHLAELIEEGLLFCTLTGGEATIHPDFPSIYSMLKEGGVVVEVFTNGRAISDELISLFVELPPRVIEISIYSLDNARLGQVFGAAGPQAASAVLENVLRLHRAGVNVTCKTFRNTLTTDEFPEISKWCADHGIAHYSSSDVTMAHDGVDLSTFRVGTTSKQLPVVQLAPKVALPCGTKNYGIAIDAAFRVFPCTAIRLPDCTFDLRTTGVRASLRQVKSFMRRFQDTPLLAGSASAGDASCMAFAKPLRDASGALLGFGQH